VQIVDVTTRSFRFRTKLTRDSEGHLHPGSEHDETETILSIATDEGVEGHSFGPTPQLVEHVIKPELLGEDPLYREKLWQRLRRCQRIHRDLNDREIAVADLALWDLAGRSAGLPVYKLLGGCRDKVLAYASTMCGDEMPDGLSSPDDYARFAEWCMKRGYKAFKLHTWMPPISWAPDPKMDVKACAAVREAVGPDVPLMLDPYHFYSREQALYLGKELEKLNFHWLEEPIDEHSISSYVWLADQLDIPILGPETAEGKMFTRAEWIVRGACDLLRAGVNDVGGLTPLMKTIHLAESFGMAIEIHEGGGGNLAALGAMDIPGEFYERGLLHPFIDYDEPVPWLNSIVDVMDEEGYVHLPQRPGLGYDINFDYIEANLTDDE
jgi:L-alanine-DL-glutamate epimerase-like enolase superfamily enzyme